MNIRTDAEYIEELVLDGYDEDVIGIIKEILLEYYLAGYRNAVHDIEGYGQ